MNLREKQSLISASSNVKTKIDLKNAAEIFGLWDNVYGKDAIRALENSMKWDPSKKDKDKKPVTAKKVKIADIYVTERSRRWLRDVRLRGGFEFKMLARIKLPLCSEEIPK